MMKNPISGRGLSHAFWCAWKNSWLHRLAIAFIAMLAMSASPAWALTSTTTTITVSPTTAPVGQTVTITATVTGSSPTGTVQFLYNGTGSFGSVALSAGKATFSYVVPYAQTLTLSAAYSGNSTNSASTSSGVSFTTTQATTTTALTSSVNPVGVGQGTTLKATVTPSTATGTVTFMGNGTTLGTGTISGGVATYVASSGTAGMYSLTAVYGGDSNYKTSTSNTVSQTVGTISTTTTLTSSANPSTTAQPTTLTATVSPSTATGTVAFKDGATTLDTVSLSSGTAAFSTGFYTAGAHSITAVYSGDASDAASTSAALSQTVTTNLQSTTTALAVNPNPVNQGQNAVLTATVTGSSPTGIVNFSDSSGPLASATLTGGVATLSRAFGSAGNDTITASYAGDGSNAASVSASTVLRIIPTTTTTVSVNPNPVLAGANATITVTVVGSNPTGTITFHDSLGTIGTATLTNGAATLTHAWTGGGVISVWAVYGGDSNNQGSTSNYVNEPINSSTATLSYSPSSPQLNQAVTLTATVSGVNATGTVTFKDGPVTLGTSNLASGSATWTQSFAVAGAHALTAAYSGDANNPAVTSSVVTLTVAQAVSAVTLLANTNTVNQNASATFVATVTGNSPTGTVTFIDNGVSLGTATLGAGTATLAYAFSTTSQHYVTANYSGDTNNLSSNSPQAAPIFVLAATTTAVAASPSTVAQNTNTTLTATVTNTGAGTGTGTGTVFFPTGTVTFKDGGTLLGTSGLNSSGVASLTTSFAAGGAHAITAVYGGDALDATSTSAAASLAVTTSLPSTTTALAINPNPVNQGQVAVLTATVTGSGLIGTVTFSDSNGALGTVNLNGNVATLSHYFGTAGNDTITASYSGDSGNAASASASTVLRIIPATTTTVGVNPNPVVSGANATITVTVVGNNPTGVITFHDNISGTIGTATLANGAATLTHAWTGGGVISVWAVYGGDSNNQGSTSNYVNEPINSSTATLSYSPNSPQLNQAVKLTATVNGTNPTGTVTFKDGSATLGTSTVSSGTATWTQSFAIAGLHSLTAVYSGDANNPGATSIFANLNVAQTVSAVTLLANSNTVNQNANATFVATVTGSSPTGIVTFFENGASLGAATLGAGTATLSYAFSTPGTHFVTASYPGDTNNLPANTPQTTPIIVLATTTMTVLISPTPVRQNTNVALTATVKNAGTVSNPTGTVTFRDGGTVLGTGSLNAGMVSLTTSFTVGGTHAVTVVYGGDSLNAASTSGIIDLAVTASLPSTTTALTINPNPANQGQSAVLTATVAGSNPTGTVTFSDSSGVLDVKTLTSGVATSTRYFLTAGNDTVTASYSGDGSNAASVSASTALRIIPTTTTTVSVNPNPVLAGANATITVTVVGSNPTGTITFHDSLGTIGTATLTNGAATLTHAWTGGGVISVWAVYGGDSNNQGSTSNYVNEPINSSTATLSYSPSSPQLNQAVTLTATVSGVNATGTVTFKDGPFTLGTSNVNSGAATWTQSFTVAGGHALTAVYSGDANNPGVTSSVAKVTVAQAVSAVTLSASANTVNQNANATFVATVTGSNPTGTVTFVEENGASIGTATLGAGAATLAHAFSTAGTHYVAANYSGDTNNQSAGVSQWTSIFVLATTTTNVGAQPNPVVQNANTTLTATVTNTGTASSPTGTVTFKDGGTVLGTGNLNQGTASLTTSFATGGTHAITVVYGGDVVNAASTSAAMSLTVSGLTSTATTLAINPNPATQGGSAMLTATVTGSTPTGTVTFSDNSGTLGTVTLSGGVATLARTFATAGSDSVTATYNGDSTHAGSSSAATALKVLATTSTAVAVNPATASLHANVTITATVSGSSPSGTVTFLDGATTLGTGTLSGGTASLTYAFSSTGTHGVTASYAGDANNAGSLAPAANLTVTSSVPLTTTSLSASPNPADPSRSVTMTATVSGASPGGTVTFYDGGTSLGAASLSGGVATLAHTFGVATHSLTAMYGGDPNNQGSTSSVVSLQVNKFATAATLTANPASPTANQAVVLTAAITGPSPGGTVAFMDGTTNLGSANVNGGVATLNTSFASTGAHSLSAIYSGDPNNAGATSSALAVAVGTVITSGQQIYVYDVLGRLKTVNVNNGAKVITYSYDAAGNRLGVTVQP